MFSQSGMPGVLFFLTFLFASIAYGVPLQNQEDSQFDKRASYLAITGLQSSGIHTRLEVRQLQKNTRQWNLYLLALNRFKGISQSDKRSYYQVAGIHGRPFVAWDGVQLGQSGGYCTHEIVLFPTWHRPYLALYEQILYGIVQEVANEMTQDKSAYVAAAKTFRTPYWDWAAPAQGGAVYPSFFKGIWDGKSSSLDISLPNGTHRINNPLYNYRFHSLSKSELPDNPFNVFPTTMRYPSSNSASAGSRNDAVAAQILQSQPSYSQRFMNILQAYSNFNNFGNEGWIPNSPGSYDSLESLHDQIHGLVGNGGHMAIIDYSAFDPIFWLHHTNIDRLFAIWQGVYPNNWMSPQKIKYGTAVLTAGQTVDQTTPLKPFHKDAAGTFWTSQTARYTTSFGYNYPETSGGTVSSVKAAVNKLYGPTSGKKITKRAEQAGGGYSSAQSNDAGRAGGSYASAQGHGAGQAGSSYASAQSNGAGQAGAHASSNENDGPHGGNSHNGPAHYGHSHGGSPHPHGDAPHHSPVEHGPSNTGSSNYGSSDSNIVNSPPSDSALPTLSATSGAQVTNAALAAGVAAGLSPEAAKSADTASGSPSTLKSANSDLPPGHYREWITNIRVEKMALQEAFFIHVFVGDFKPDPACWSFEPNLVGSHAVFTPFTNATSALSSGTSSIITGTIPLTRNLNAQAEDGKLNLDCAEEVEAYLRKNLHWRITRMDDTFVPSSEVQDLKISVVSSVVKEAEAEDDFPVWGDFTVHPAVTEGRDGGLCLEDDS